MIKVVNKSLLAIAVSGILASPAVNATNGYFSHGYSTKEKGLAGAGAAYSQDSMAAATNPAGMAFVGERMDIGLQLFSPSRSYTVTGTPLPPPPAPGSDPMLPFGSAINAQPGVEVDSESNFFLIPSFGYNWQMNDDSTIGVSVYGNGGMNSDYPASDTPNGMGTFGAGDTGINMAQLFVNVSFAKKLNDKHAFGASVILGGQRFMAKGLESFAAFSSDPNNLSGNRKSDSFGAGLKFGYQGEVTKGIRLGVSYQSKVKMDEFDEYAGLFAKGGNFDIPASYTLGVSFEVGSSGMIVADIQEIKYSGVASISNPMSNLFPPAGCGGGDLTQCLGGSNGAGFGWEDMTVYKIGYQFEADNSTYRIGYSHAEQPIPESEVFFNILAPAVIEDHITAGWTLRVGDNQEFNISGLYAPSNSVKGSGLEPGVEIEIEMSQWEVQAGWAWKY